MPLRAVPAVRPLRPGASNVEQIPEPLVPGQALDARARARFGARGSSEARRLAGLDIVAVALTWVDISGITRTKTVPVERLEHASAWGVGMSPVFDAYLLDDSIVPGRHVGGPVGDLRLHPDLDRLVPLAALPGWAHAPAFRYDQDGAVHPLDTRALLRRLTNRLADDGWTVKAAFEIEWAVSRGAGEEFSPAVRGPAYGMTRITELAGYLRDVLTALKETGVTVMQLHPEYAAGQYEVSVAAEDPLGAADTAVVVRETIRAVSMEHGLAATFSPKVEPDSVGNGAHVHLSLWRSGGEGPVNAMAGGEGPCEMSAPGEAFAAGILRRLPALLAIGAPSVASYLRLIPSHWAGAFTCWGPENREAALRVVTGAEGERPAAANLEVKCLDAAANPYLVLAALLAAGHEGLGGRRELPAPVDVDPATLPEEERVARGIVRLPASLDEAVAAFEADDVLRDALGDAVADTVATVRRGEIELLAGATPEQITAATRWRH
ncbi:glutamine synthetase [Actinomadura sp. 6K520]|nr:glutamine synthetase [Actinomadura sp. 6K520]